MSKSSFSSVALLLAICTQAGAATSPFTFHQRHYPVSAGACSLESFTLTTNVFSEGSLEGKDYFTTMAAVIETNKPECLRNYAIVQWIHGCVTEQTFNSNTGELSEKYFGQRDDRGGQSYFTSPEWSVDTVDVDPMYESNSSGSGQRMDDYLVAKTPLRLTSDLASLKHDDHIYEESSARYFLQDPATAGTRQAFVTDLPETAEYYHEAGKPIGLLTSPSLEFQTCLYDVSDIPLTGNPASPNTPHALGGPVQCFSWSHKYEFDTTTRDFKKVTTPGIDSSCLAPTPTPDPASPPAGETATPVTAGSSQN